MRSTSGRPTRLSSTGTTRLPSPSPDRMLRGPAPTGTIRCDDGQRQEEREDRQAEARDREQRPAAAGDAERYRQAERRKEPVRRAEAPPGDHRQCDEECEEGEILEVQGRDADWVGVLHRGPV